MSQVNQKNSEHRLPELRGGHCSDRSDLCTRTCRRVQGIAAAVSLHQGRVVLEQKPDTWQKPWSDSFVIYNHLISA